MNKFFILILLPILLFGITSLPAFRGGGGGGRSDFGNRSDFSGRSNFNDQRFDRGDNEQHYYNRGFERGFERGYNRGDEGSLYNNEYVPYNPVYVPYGDAFPDDTSGDLWYQQQTQGY